MFKYELIDEEATTVISFEGDLDIDATELMEEEIAPKLYDCSNIKIDFSKVQFVDSSGIGLLITLIHHLRERGIRVRIFHVSDEVRIVFEMLQLPDIMGADVLPEFEHS
ncbi:STAS domain-containing protein [Cohnella pontilimi]|uniref:Anti-sigma factor antagonist n=1 Tax=Cohnella pontilimi TaxID=2564100 RepID=A0A4U0FDJ3_9BACL|nr:STAS domain-containing protein [Cohnella pontilimi]TJY42847.1 STAS domain-containing protein [Cohnella pontilimi]